MTYNSSIHHRRSIRLKGYDYSQWGAYFITICCEGRICRFGSIQKKQMDLNQYGEIAYNEWGKLTDRFSNFELDVFQIMPNHIHGIIVLNDDNVGAGFTPAQNSTNDDTVHNQNDFGMADIRAGVNPAQNENGNDDIIRAGVNPAQNENGNDNIIRAGVNPAQNGYDDDNVGVGFTPALNSTNDDTVHNQNDFVMADIRAGVNPAPTINEYGFDNRAGVNPAPTIGNIIGAYKSLVANGCLKIYKSNNETMGKLWQRNYWEHIIRNNESYGSIADYIINNPAKWQEDKFYVI